MTRQTSILPALRRQAACYQRLAKLAAIQHEHVLQGRTESLLEVLQMRQAELDEAALLEQKVAPIRRQWAEHIAGLSPAERMEAENLMREIRALLQKITAADRDDVLALQQKKLSLGRQISQTRAAGRVNRHYAAAAYGRRAATMDVGG